METCFRISLLIATVCLSVYAKNPTKDHIFVFEGETLTIDCAGGEAEPILQYRHFASEDPITYFIGAKVRTKEAQNITARQNGNDIYYEIKEAVLDDGGEYECDWTAANDETNHYVNVIDASTIQCPEFTGPVMADEPVNNLSCSITKFGTVIHDWLKDPTKADALGLKFTIVDSQGNDVKVVYEETQDTLVAKVADLALSKEQNGTTLSCKIVSVHGTDATCTSNEAQVHWKASGLEIAAPEIAEIGKAFEVKCPLVDSGNPPAPVVFKVNDVETADFNVTGTKELGPVLNVSCAAGDVQSAKSVLLYADPESVTPSVEIIPAEEGDKLEFACTAEESYPDALIAYKIGGMDVEPNATAKAEYNGKEITCTATNTVSRNQVTGQIALNIKFAPRSTSAAESVEGVFEEAAALDCSMDANPAPTFQWTFTPKDSDNSSPKPRALETDSAKHEITSLTPEDLGSYVCKATNDFGSFEKTFTLQEKEANVAVALLAPITLILSFLSTTLNIQ